MRFFHALLCLAVTAALASPAPASVVWFGDNAGLHQIDAASNQVVADIAFEPPVSIVVNAADGSAWVLTQSRLARVSVAGTVQFQVALRDLGSGNGSPRLLALNPNDGSVWAAFQNRVLQFDGAGALRRTVHVAAEDVAVAQDGSVWLLASSSLQKVDGPAIPIAQAMKYLAVDDTGGAVWLAGGKDVLKLSLSAPYGPLAAFVAPETVSAISVDAQTGTLWLLGQNGLFAFTRSGSPSVSRDLRDFSIANPSSLAFDFGSQSAWVGHQRGLSRLTTAGTLAVTFPATPNVGAIAIGRAPVDITPVVTILLPADGSLTNDSTPLLRVDYDALCSGNPCGFPNSFFSSFTLSAQLNGNEVGGSFVFDPATGTASFTPGTPLPEGVNHFSAQAHDRFGGNSNVASVSFTIDTIAPQFTDVAPPNGSVFTSPSVMIRGNVDDPTANVTLGSQSQGQSFSFPVTLIAGANQFTLIAKDPAGNTTPLTLTYTYEPPNVPPLVNITSPANQANFEAPANVTVTADATDPDGSIVRVEFFSNGQPAGIDTTFPYSASLTNLGAGSYSLTVRAVDNRNGASVSDPVNIFVGPPNALPTVRIISPTGTAQFSSPALIPVTAQAADSDGTIAKVEFFRNGVLAATVTSGTPDFSTTLQSIPAGSQTITAKATDDRGGTAVSAAVTVIVNATTLTITSPLPNASIAGNAVLVTGRYTGLSNAGVAVNGEIAAVDPFNNFSVLVPVALGANTLTAKLMTVDGTTLTQSVNVSASGEESPYAVIAEPAVGLAPLTATITITNPTTAGVSVTFDGSPFTLPAGSSGQFIRTYLAGVVVHTVVFTNPANRSFTQRVIVESRDPARMDQMFRAIWSGMNNALVAGDRNGAMRYLDNSAKAKFGPIFDVILPFAPEIVASYSPLGKSAITAKIGEYAVSRLDGTQRRLYLIYFMLDADGVWRIDDM